ncbi:S8 family serine peptidase [Bacillus sp. SL00103]
MHEFNWYDATTGSEAPYDLEHGTHVTGTMVGSEPDGKNQTGVAPGANGSR